MKPIYLAVIICAVLGSLSFAQPTSSVTPIPSVSPAPTTSETNSIVTIQLTSSFVNFCKVAVWMVGLFLAALAFIGIAFFGFDVRKARSSIQAAEDDVRK